MKTDYINPDTINSLHELLKARVKRTPDTTAYQFYCKHDSSWQTITWQAVYDKVCHWANALAHEDLQPGNRVAILIRNSLEWILFEQASFANHLVVVPLYPEDRAENMAYIIRDAEVKILLIEDSSHLDRLSTVSGQFEPVNRIISLNRLDSKQISNTVVNLEQWLDKPPATPSPPISKRDTLASIVYTSGTTGKPKGVMLSHDNIMQNAWAGVHSIDVYPSDHFLSFLPISHMLERTVGYYIPMMSGARVSFSRSIADLAEDILSQNPSVMITVPRIFERVYNKIEDTISQKNQIIRWLFHYSIDVAWKHFQYKQHKASWNIQFLLLGVFDRLFHKKIREKFGDKFRFAISGGAPLDYHIARMFIALGIEIAQGYGLTEYSPIISVNHLDDNNPRSVGMPLPGVEVRTDDNQELLVKGKSIMQGYWKNQEATSDVIDEQGWLHTGDKADIIDNKIYITGRIKDIIVLSTGEKVPPCEIEQAILQDPLFENIVVVGEKRPYLSALVIPNYDLVGSISNESLSINDELLEHIKVKMTAFPGYARIHKISICKEPWTIENGMLTPTLKPRRQYIIDQHLDKIDEMYHGRK